MEMPIAKTLTQRLHDPACHLIILLCLYFCLSSGVSGLRLEKLPEEWFEYNKAFPTVTEFYGSAQTATADEGEAKRLDGGGAPMLAQG